MRDCACVRKIDIDFGSESVSLKVDKVAGRSHYQDFQYGIVGADIIIGGRVSCYRLLVSRRRQHV